jgi:CO/xanthine dehydrogenase Mo-binding subunit
VHTADHHQSAARHGDHGGVAHGIGNAFYEQLVYDEQGQLLNASFMDYLLPTATDIPSIETAHRETPSPFNPIGLKGVGEAGCIPTGAAFAQAVEDALNIEILEIPLSPNRLFSLMLGRPTLLGSEQETEAK